VTAQTSFDALLAMNGKAELRDAAAAENKTLPIHRWVPWIAGFSAQFVEDAISAYLPDKESDDQLVLDPFAGVGTTQVEALRAGRSTFGYEINAFAALAANAKVMCVDASPDALRARVEAFRSTMSPFESDVDAAWKAGGADALAEKLALLRGENWSGYRSRIPFFSPPVEVKFLYALQHAATLREPHRTLFRTALGATMVSISNYSYEPSLSSRPGAGKPLIENTSVIEPVGAKLDDMCADIEWARTTYGARWRRRNRSIIHGSYFDSDLTPRSVALVVTSPPYMNNYHYIRNTRPQLHWLGLMNDARDLQDYEQQSFGKFWQTVRQGKPVGLAVNSYALRQKIDHLRELSPERGQYGGPGWANYVATYMNDTDRFAALLKRHLQPGARAVVVVGNSIIQGIEFKVDHLLAEIAERRGLAVDDIHIVRTKRVGNSIIDSSVRNGHAENGAKHTTQLYDAAVVLRR